MIDGLVTTAACTKGALPERNQNDIYCPLMGGPVHKSNYPHSACRARQLANNCNHKDCERRVNLVRPGLVQVSSEGVKQEQRRRLFVGKTPLRKCAECKRMMAISGRGLCGACLHRLRKAGTLDEKYPSLRPRKASKKHGQAIKIVFGERETGIYKDLVAWADEERSSVEDHVLHVLENIVNERRG